MGPPEHRFFSLSSIIVLHNPQSFESTDAETWTQTADKKLYRGLGQRVGVPNSYVVQGSTLLSRCMVSCHTGLIALKLLCVT